MSRFIWIFHNNQFSHTERILFYLIFIIPALYWANQISKKVNINQKRMLL